MLELLNKARQGMWAASRALSTAVGGAGKAAGPIRGASAGATNLNSVRKLRALSTMRSLPSRVTASSTSVGKAVSAVAGRATQSTVGTASVANIARSTTTSPGWSAKFGGAKNLGGQFGPPVPGRLTRLLNRWGLTGLGRDTMNTIKAIPGDVRSSIASIKSPRAASSGAVSTNSKKPWSVAGIAEKFGSGLTGPRMINAMEATGAGLFRAAQAPFALALAPLTATAGAVLPAVGHIGIGGLRGAASGLAAMSRSIAANPTGYAKYGAIAGGVGMGAYGAFSAGRWGARRTNERHNDMANTMGLTQSLDAAYG